MPLHPLSRRSLAPLLSVMAALAPAVAAAQNAEPGKAEPPATRPATSPARRVPEALNFANGLFRERRYELAAQEYERFLREAKPGPEADEALFGLANARLFQAEYSKARGRFEEFLKQAPEHPNAGTAWYRVGETSYMLGDLPAARRAFEAFTTRYPAHKHLDTAWPYLGDVCLRIGDVAAARRAYETALAAHPEGRLADRARFGLGRALTLQNELEPALAAFTTLAAGGGKDWADRAWFRVGEVQSLAGRPAQAVEAFQKVEEVAPQGPLVHEARLARAQALIKLDRRDEAEPILKGLADAPRNLAAQAAFDLGTSQLERGDAAAALGTLDAASAKFGAAALVFRSAEAAAKLGRGDDARARFLKAAEADPKDPWADDALLRAARLAADQRDHAEAAKLAARFVETFPDSPLKADARLVAARAALAAGKPQDAVAILTDSMEHDKPSAPTAAAQRYYLGIAYRDAGQASKADEVLADLAKDSAAPVAADARFMVGQGHMEARRYAEAADALEKYLATKPDGDVAAYALAHLVQARLELAQPEAADKALADLAERFPASKVLPPSRVRVAEAALATKNYEKAAGLFSLAADAPGTDPAVAARARLGFGWAKFDGGKPAEAAEAFASFLAARPDDPLAPEASLARARSLEAAKQADAALEAYARTAASYPATESADLATLGRARLCVAAGKGAEAAALFEAFDKDHPNYKPRDPQGPGLDALLSDWGWALVDAGKAPEADAVFRRLLKDFPDSPHAADARFNLAESANQAKDHAEVVRLVTPLVAEGSKVSPQLVQSALYRLGRTQAETKDWAAAAATLDRLLKDYPDAPVRREARLLRAEVAQELNDGTAADTVLAELAAEPALPTDPPGFARAVRRRRIQSLLALKKWAEVVETADALKAESPDDPLAAETDYARGRALQQLARWDESRAAYKAVIDARKGGDLVARAQLMIGETYFHQKDYHEAIRQFLKVDILYDAPAWQAAALLETGKAHEQLAQWADAADTYERLRSKFPDDPSAREAATRLAAARSQIGAAPKEEGARR